jgi:hypothetical protein
MADEGTLGIARAGEVAAEEHLSKAELQKRLDETRDSISQTVSEIKETVASQVQAVKESLDWREQFKRRPVAWSVGAMGLGFVTGWGIAAVVRSRTDEDERSVDYYGEQTRAYAASPILRESESTGFQAKETDEEESSGPGVLNKIANSAAYDKVRREAATVGDLFIRELGNTAKVMVLPAVMKSIKDFVGAYLPSDTRQKGSADLSKSSERSSYEPRLERDQGQGL